MSDSLHARAKRSTSNCQQGSKVGLQVATTVETPRLNEVARVPGTGDLCVVEHALKGPQVYGILRARNGILRQKLQDDEMPRPHHIHKRARAEVELLRLTFRCFSTPTRPA